MRAKHIIGHFGGQKSRYPLEKEIVDVCVLPEYKK
jgi:hypothetical protein